MDAENVCRLIFLFGMMMFMSLSLTASAVPLSHLLAFFKTSKSLKKVGNVFYVIE